MREKKMIRNINRARIYYDRFLEMKERETENKLTFLDVSIRDRN